MRMVMNAHVTADRVEAAVREPHILRVALKDAGLGQSLSCAQHFTINVNNAQ